jgi:hypothetical protein
LEKEKIKMKNGLFKENKKLGKRNNREYTEGENVKSKRIKRKRE